MQRKLNKGVDLVKKKDYKAYFYDVVFKLTDRMEYYQFLEYCDKHNIITNDNIRDKPSVINRYVFKIDNINKVGKPKYQVLRVGNGTFRLNKLMTFNDLITQVNDDNEEKEVK